MGTIIFTTGYPRSGTWWVTRLLSDLLDSPILGLPPSDIRIDDFCRTARGGHTIYKTHLRAHEWDGTGKVVFIQRDPRDVAVSAMYYRTTPNDHGGLIHTIESMGRGISDADFRIYGIRGVYEAWMRGWMWGRAVIHVRYEWLHRQPRATLNALLQQLGFDSLRNSYIDRAIERNRFSKWTATYPHALRKGIAGDWKNHFRQEHGRLITTYLGQLMMELGYIESLDWWMKLAKK